MDIPQITSTETAEIGCMGQKYLATGKHVAMRRWEEKPCTWGEMHTRQYETVGYVIAGELELDLDGETARLKSGDSWLVPAGAPHRYQIVQPLVAIEATSPPARLAGRDAGDRKESSL